MKTLEAHPLQSVVLYTTSPWEHALPVLRVRGPLEQRGVRVIQGNEYARIDLEPIHQSDGIVIQRDFPRYWEAYQQVVAMARTCNKPIIFDIDDPLFELPPEHPDHQSGYYAGALLPVLHAILEANLVTTSTLLLSDYLQVFNPNVRLLPNYMDESLWTFRSPPERAASPVVLGYMGGDSHRPDVDSLVPVFVRLLERYGSQLRLRFWCIEPPEDLRGYPQVDWLPFTLPNYSRFADYFSNQEADIFVAPLLDSFFNHCKSPLKFLEYSVLGVPGVYSRVAAYEPVIEQGKNGFLAATLDEWENALIRLIEDPNLRRAIGLAAQQTTREKWLLSQHAQEWVDVYREVLTGGKLPVSQAHSTETARLARTIIKLREQQNEAETQRAREEQILQSVKAQLAHKEQSLEVAPEADALPFTVSAGGQQSEKTVPLVLEKENLKPIASIIILTYNHCDYTRQCLESVLAKTDAPEYEIVVVDNASADDTPLLLQEVAASHPNIKLILNEKNEGFSRGNNLGAAVASGEYVVFLNNDVVVTHGWLSGLVRHLQDPAVGMVGPVTNASGNESRIEVDYSWSGGLVDGLSGMQEFAERYVRQHAGEAFEIGMLPFHCVALRRTVFEEIGPLDERFGVGMFEDDDYATRLLQVGYKILCAEDVFVHHWGSVSFSRLGQVEYRRLFEENRRKLEEKWGTEWQPHLYRPALLRKQMREVLDNTAWLAAQIAEHEARIAERDAEIAGRDAEIAGRDRKILEFQYALDQTEQAKQALNADLYKIYSSRAWKVTQSLWRLRMILVPYGSLRSRLLKGVSVQPYRFTRNLFSRGLNWLRRKRERPRISWPAYAFVRFRRARQTIYPPDLTTLRCPAEPGLISIVLPVYNGADYVREALDSLLEQTYPHFELIIVDDGSTDATPRILEEYAQKDSRLHILSQQNQRLPRALSNGFRTARGEFLTWTSADNRLNPDCLEKLVACLRRHPQWDMTYANLDIIGDNGQPLHNSGWYSGYQNPPGSPHISLPADITELNTVANNYVGAAFLYRSRVDNLLGDYSPRRFGAEDYDYWMRVNALFTLCHADFYEPIYEYRFHGTSLTARDEELGITRRRDALMVFENARQDFYLTPLAWQIVDDGSPQAQAVAGKMRDWAAAAGHILIDRLPLAMEELPRLWFPLTAVRVTANPEDAAVEPAGPANACKVVIVAGEGTLPAQANPGWDVCITTSANAQLPCLNKPRQGWLSVPEIPTLCTAIDIRVKSTHLALLEAEITNPAPPELKISVVISTYRRGAQLADAVRSVAQQTFPAVDYEIIVVNNAPADTSAGAIVKDLRQAEFAGCEDRLRLVVCPFEGLSFARNAGIAEARGRVVSFLDDDATAFPNWLEQIWQAFESFPGAGVVGGQITLDPPKEQPRWLKPGWEHLWGSYNPPYSEAKAVQNWWEYPWGGNWSATRQALLAMGGFRTNYGRRGSDFGGGEELIAASLIQRLGYGIVVAPAARIYHIPHFSRYNFRHVRRTIHASKLSEYAQRVDLYVPGIPDVRSLKEERWKHVSVMLFQSGLKTYQRLEHWLYAQALSRVLARLHRDLRERANLFRRMGTRRDDWRIKDKHG